MTAKTIHSPKSGHKLPRVGLRQNNFRKEVLGFYTKQGRHTLPWRKTANSYRILVSEVMLQQTQVDRVTPYYKAFLKKFPTVQALAQARLNEVLKLWQGLGYNRRAKMLHEAAKNIMIYHNCRIPREYSKLVMLPGVGDYTAKAIRTFAFNEPEIMIETNIRAVFLHYFFQKRNDISDKELFSVIEKHLDTKNPRIWYWALMDYGAHLKKTLPNPSRKSAHHAKQKPFKGSDREIRGAIVRATLNGEKISKLPFDAERIKVQRAALKKEGLI